MSESSVNALKEELAGLLHKMVDVGNSAVDGAIQVAPVLVKEILWYNGVASAIWLSISVVGFVLLWRAFKWLNLETKEERGGHAQRTNWKKAVSNGDDVPIVCVGCSIFLVSMFMLIVNCLSLLKIFFAPHIYLLEYAAKLGGTV